MKILDLIKEKTRSILSAKSITYDYDLADYDNTINQFNRLRSPREQIKFYVGWVYACIEAQARETATINFNLFANTSTFNTLSLQKKSLPELSSNARRIENHIVLDLLSCPNPFLTQSDAIHILITHLRLTGNAFWLLGRNGVGAPNVIYPLDPTQTRIVINRNGLPSHFETVIDGHIFKLDYEEIVHFKNPNPANIYSGMGVIEASYRTLQLDAFSDEYDLAYSKNAPLITGHLQLPNKRVEPTVEKRFQKVWQRKYTGILNAGKLAVLGNDIEFVPNRLRKLDIISLEQKKFNRDQTLAMFNTSATNLGIDSATNRATAEASEYALTKRVINPNMHKITDTLNSQLLPQYDSKLILTHDNPIPADKKHELAVIQQLTDKVITRNEARVQLGYEPIGPDGDTLYQSAADIPLGLLAELDPPPSDETAPADDNN